MDGIGESATCLTCQILTGETFCGFIDTEGCFALDKKVGCEGGLSIFEMKMDKMIR
jgi:hypothetical protein